MANNVNQNASEMQQPINLCRCCLAEGCYKDISTEYFTNGQKEVYAAMLLETFNLSISYHEGGGPSTESRLICDDCIMSLRDSYNFKKMVLHSEETFKEQLERLRKPPGESTVQVKQETYQVDDSEDESSEDFNVDGVNDDGNIADDSLSNIKIEGCKTEPMNFTSEDETQLVIQEEPTRKRRIHRRKVYRTEEGQLVTRMSKSAKGIVQDFQESTEPSCSDAASKGGTCSGSSSRKRTSKNIKSNEKKAAIRNAMKLIQYSNMCPFRWNLQYLYKCFCCEKTFRNVKLLKAHTKSKHVIEEVKTKITRHYHSLHNVDISSLRCDACAELVSDIVDLKAHLSEKHRVTMETAEDVLVPFKLEEDDAYKCVLCPEQFQHLHSFNIHMNTHFKNFVCYVCGAGFRCSNRMNMHLKRHKQRQHRCDACDVTFASSYKKQKHDVAVHDKKLRMKCPLCSERFHEYYARLAHQINVHNVEQPKHECQFCHKQYLFKHRLQQHIRREHLKEKNHACEECGLKFFAKDMLKRHMISHNGEKVHECTFCKKSYARRGTLREHMKIHLNIRKWICNVCGEAFVQNCSLKNHLKKHS